MAEQFPDLLKRIYHKYSFIQFDTFMIKELGFALMGDCTDELMRKQSFGYFRKLTQNQRFASLPTMRRWFGIGGYSKPSRECIFEICFSLQGKPDDVERFLTHGIGEPSFQINDYQEMIFLYGFENGLGYASCLKMIEMFEKNLDQDISFQKTHTTHELLQQYLLNKHLDKEEFVLWMSDRADWFKGYSQTSLDYLIQFKKTIVENIREEALERLNEYLNEAGFERWRQRHRDKGKDSRELIRKFANGNISGDFKENIIELYKIAYDNRETNSRLLGELYSTFVSKQNTNFGGLKVMTEKYISDLFNIPTQKERMIRTRQAIQELEGLPQDNSCPEWIAKIGEEYVSSHASFSTVACAQEELIKYKKEQKRRCLLLQRNDILPFVLHVSQLNYLKENSDEYCRERALTMFENLANATLNACNMPPLSDEYEMDVTLISCYQDNEMYTYADVLDAINE